MKRILAYILVAALLGVVTMLAPFTLFVSEMNTSEMYTDEMEPQAERLLPYVATPDYMQKVPSKTEQAYGITPATHPTDTMFIVFLTVFSLIIALGAASYSKRSFRLSLP